LISRLREASSSVNGTATPDVAALDTWAQSVRVGDIAELVIFRAGEEITVTVVFAEDISAEEGTADAEFPAAA
jgi:hypothetical protein